MAHICCLARIDRTAIPLFGQLVRVVGAPALATVATLDVTRLGKLQPSVLVCDVDAVDVDPLELLRRTRFVLPDCLIAVYTAIMQRTWGVACHRAGVNCLLSKKSNGRDLAQGMRNALWTGCHTDPRFVQAWSHTPRPDRLQSV